MMVDIDGQRTLSMRGHWQCEKEALCKRGTVPALKPFALGNSRITTGCLYIPKGK